VEPNQIDIFAFTVLRDFEQIDDSQKPRLSRQLWRDIRKANRFDGIDFDLTFLHRVSRADLDMGTRPDPDAASNLPLTNSLPKALRENHDESLHLAADGTLVRPDTRLYDPRMPDVSDLRLDHFNRVIADALGFLEPMRRPGGNCDHVALAQVIGRSAFDARTQPLILFRLLAANHFPACD
jgi:hypothetical protein